MLEGGKMNYEEFKEQMRSEDYNIVTEWKLDRFKVICQECKSDNVIVFAREESGCMGSEYTGYMKGFNHDAGIIVKCKDCGSAMDMRIEE